MNIGAPEPDPTVLAGQRTCTDVTPDTSIGDMMWVLTHSTDAAFTTTTTVQAEHMDIGGLGSTLWFDSINPSGGPVLTNPAAVPGDGFGSGQPATTGFASTAFLVPALAAGEFYYWQKIDVNGNAIGGADSTAQAGSYFYVMCAYIDGSGLDAQGNMNSSPQDDDWGGLAINANTQQVNNGAENQNIVVAKPSIWILVD